MTSATLSNANPESAHLEAIAHNSQYAAGANAAMIRYSFRIFQRFMRRKRVLELGPAEGLWS